MGTKNMDEFKTLINIVEEKFEPDINILQKIYIGLRCKWNRYRIYGPYRTMTQGEEERTIQLSNTNKEFIKLLVDETKINHTLYEDLQKTNEKLFLSNVQSLIDKNKYNKYDISKYILDYDKHWNEKTHNMSVQIPELTNKYLFLSNN